MKRPQSSPFSARIEPFVAAVGVSDGPSQGNTGYKSITAATNGRLPPVKSNAAEIAIKDSDVFVTREARGPTIRFSPNVKDKLLQPW